MSASFTRRCAPVAISVTTTVARRAVRSSLRSARISSFMALSSASIERQPRAKADQQRYRRLRAQRCRPSALRSRVGHRGGEQTRPAGRPTRTTGSRRRPGSETAPRPAGSPPESTNCGRKAMKKIATLGFRSSTTTLSASARRTLLSRTTGKSAEAAIADHADAEPDQIKRAGELHRDEKLRHMLEHRREPERRGQHMGVAAEMDAERRHKARLCVRGRLSAPPCRAAPGPGNRRTRGREGEGEQHVPDAINLPPYR